MTDKRTLTIKLKEEDVKKINEALLSNDSASFTMENRVLYFRMLERKIQPGSIFDLTVQITEGPDKEIRNIVEREAKEIDARFGAIARMKTNIALKSSKIMYVYYFTNDIVDAAFDSELVDPSTAYTMLVKNL